MLGGAKKFIKNIFLKKEHPFIYRLWYGRKERKIRALQEAHSRMTYAQIEAAINRNYMDVFGRQVNWENPQTYNEKIQVSKLYMPTPLKTRLADKVAVREWIAEKIGSEYLIPLLGVYDSFEEIDFDALPDSFVIKCNHDSGSVTLVKDKSKINKALLKHRYDLSLKTNYAWHGWEMHYRDIPPKIIIEQYMGDAINDYKFFCPGRKPLFCQVDFNRFTNHTRDFYSPEWKLQPLSQDVPNSSKEQPCPPEYPKMLEIAQELCKAFEQVRVDLYLVGGHIYFGEMTFTDGGGWSVFVPDEWDYKLGALWPFDTSIRSQVLARSSRP